MQKANLTGQTFHELTVIKETQKSAAGYVRWLCQCSCGRETIVQGNNLKSGAVKSCGCIIRYNNLKHGHAKKGEKQTPEYTAWCSTISICENPANERYHLYGGKGIKISDIYKLGENGLSGFQCFVRDIGARPSAQHTLNRYPNPVGNFEPGNIRWAIRETTEAIDNLNGKLFGRLTVIEYAGKRGNRILWRCQCSCKKQSLLIVASGHLKSGHTQSCGCLKGIRNYKPKQTNNVKLTPEYSIWYHIVLRCTDPLNPRYESYGGRGITVCDRWRFGEGALPAFECFIKDMGLKPSKKAVIDRKNNDAGYSPDNCAWVTRTESARNTRRNIYFEYQGRKLTLIEWSGLLGIRYLTLYGRYKRGWSVNRMFEGRSIQQPTQKKRERVRL